MTPEQECDAAFEQLKNDIATNLCHISMKYH